MNRAKLGGFVISAALMVLGIIVLLQGLGQVPGGLNGEARWSGVGGALMVAGLLGTVVSYRMRR